MAFVAVVVVLILAAAAALYFALRGPSTPEAKADAECAALYERYVSLGLVPPDPRPELPPMGYNPRNHAGIRASEETVLAATRTMSQNGMRDVGYHYVGLDDGWQGPRDVEGNLTSDPVRFKCGIPRLARYVHDAGFLFGIYASSHHTACGGGPGNAGNVERDVRTFAEWGVDLVRLDFCGGDYDADGIEVLLAQWQRAMDESGRHMLLMVNADSTPAVRVPASRGDSFQLEGDLCPAWRFDQSVPECYDPVLSRGVADYMEVDWNTLRPFVSPGHFVDPGMLQVGNGLNLDEARSQFTMWAMWSAPLIAGNEVSIMQPGDQASTVLQNEDIIAVAQDPLVRAAELIGTDGDLQYWRKEVRDGVVLAAVNLGDDAETARLTSVQTRITGVEQVTNLWTGNRTTLASVVSEEVPPHGVVVLRYSTTNP